MKSKTILVVSLLLTFCIIIFVSSTAFTKSTTATVKLTMFEEAKNANDNHGFLAAFEKETGIKVEFNVVPGEGPDKYRKIDIALMSGDETDLIKLDNPNFQAKYAGAKLITPLNSLAKNDKYDLEKIYGKYLTKYDGKKGNIYYLPSDISMNVVFYNKKIFDDAKVPYPKGPWTWEQYVETAKKLTNLDKGIYGSLMQQWEYYLYIQAEQKKIPPYKKDGTSNLDHPAWKDSLKWFGDLGNVLKIQPSWLEMSTKKITWDSFSSGKYGMQYIGSWYTSLFNDPQYPRDWNYGVAPGPGENILCAGGAISINANSKHKKEAFRFVKYYAENQYKVLGAIPARVDLSKDDYLKLFVDVCAKNKPGDATPEDYVKAFIDNGQGAVPEKIIGPAAAQINDMYVKEGELYLIGSRSLDETMKVIKQKADEAIKKEKEVQ